MAFDQKLAINIAAQVTGSDKIQGLTKDVTALRGSAQGIESAFGAAGNAIKGLAAAFGVQQVLSFTKGLIDLGDELKATSEKFGISASMLSKFKTAAELSDVSFETLSGGIKKLSVAMIEANTKGGEAAKAFTQIGVSIKNSDGTLKTNSQLLLDIADKFSKTEDGARKAAASVAIFGKSGTDLIPFLNQGSAALQEFGLNIDDDFAAKADNFNDNITKITVNFKNFAVSAVKDLLPALNDVTGALAEMGAKKGSSGFGFFESLGEAIKKFSLVWYGAAKSIDAGTNLMSYGLSRAVLEAKYAYEQISNYISTTTKKAFSKSSDTAGIQSEYVKREELRRKAFESSKQGLGMALDDVMKQDGKDIVEYFSKLYNKLESGAKPSRISDAAGFNFKDEAGAKDAKEKEKGVQRFIDSLNSQIGKENELTKALKDQYVEFEKMYGPAGIQSAIDTYVQHAAESGTMMKNLFTQAFLQIEDALTSFVKTGKLNFKELTDFISTELIRISIRQSIISPLLGSLTGFLGGAIGAGGDQVIPDGGLPVNMAANGDIMTKDGPLELKKYARGGIANSPQLSIFGEGSTPEAYVPLPDGRRIPVNMKGGGNSSNNVSVSVNINQSTGETDVQSQSMFGQKLGVAIQNAVKQELIMQRRPGGYLT